MSFLANGLANTRLTSGKRSTSKDSSTDKLIIYASLVPHGLAGGVNTLFTVSR
jgi:hypothetical protein